RLLGQAVAAPIWAMVRDRQLPARAEFGKLNMLGDAPKLLDESFVTAAQPGRPFGESDRL
ncbi:MAG TPA: hypothetical protein VJ782_02630, partial [Aeromicrobium sp.]|nr:hypothetical protein [Aeromicrobium sp.]